MTMLSPLQQLMRRKIPQRNWDLIQQDCKAVLDMFGNASSPRSLVRLGDGEMKILQPPQHSIVPELVKAIQHADCLGLPGGYGFKNRGQAWRTAILNALRENHQTELNPPLNVGANLIILSPELIGQLARGKRILWITSNAEQIVNNLKHPAFCDFYELHDIAGNIWINIREGGFNSRYPKGGGMYDSYTDIQQQLAQTADFDLAFVGAGLIGKPVCHHIKTRLGKTAIDIGALMSILQGLRNRPTLQPDGLLDFLVWKGGIDS